MPDVETNQEPNQKEFQHLRTAFSRPAPKDPPFKACLSTISWPSDMAFPKLEL